MAKLTFDINALRPVIEHAQASKKFSAPYGQGKAEPALFFVKDSGIYLMSAGLPAQIVPGETERRIVIYAKGYEPDAPDSYDKCYDAVGGDDFCDALPLGWFTTALDYKHKNIHLHVGTKKIRCTTS